MFSKLYFLSLILFILSFVANARAATFTVTLGGDSVNDVCDQFCSLREAINAANANGAGADTINFNLGAAVTTIQPLSPLPIIKTSLVIDGTTQSGYTNQPIVVLDGNGAGNSNGLTIATPASNSALDVTIKALTIMRFNFNGVFSNCTNTCNVSIKGNRIGTNSSGQIAQGNQSHGIFIVGSPNSVYNIGGTLTNDGNVISANAFDGIYLTPAANTTANIYGNTIGLNAAGTIDFGNGADGIGVGALNEPNQMIVNIGGTNPAARNIISGNNGNGIQLSGQLTYVYGNFIGTNASGSADLGNSVSGIAITGNAVATIGGTIFDQNGGNVISGNEVYGISLNVTDLPAPIIICRNKIGTNAAGTSALGNTHDGISFVGTSQPNVPIIVGSDAAASDGNLISGNGVSGIDINNGVTNVHIWGNAVGTNDSRTAKIPNQRDGISIGGGANEIGAAGNATAANTISGNAKNGVHLFNTATAGTKIYNNYIGTNSAGAANLGNAENGVLIGLPDTPVGKPSGNEVGGINTNAGNQIAFNAADGVKVLYGNNNRIESNAIYSNGGLGIDLGTDDAVTPNDADDSDTGGNDLQNFPVLINASPAQLYGKITSKPSTSPTQYAIDFYRVDSCDASGYGEGRYWLGRRVVSIPAGGTAEFNYLNFNLNVGQIITATATVGTGSTSEFSPCLTVNPPPGNLSLSALNYTANEGAGMKTIVVNRTNGNFGTVQVNYATSDGTAIAGQDYSATSGTLTFLNGETVKTFDIPIINDALNEGSETINISLSNPTNGATLVSPETAILTIQDNDALPTFSIDDVSQAEGNAGTTQFTFHVTLSAPSGLPTAVDFATANDTATASSDYAAASGHLDFAPGETTKPIVISVIGDLTPELDETFFVKITSTTNAGFGDGVGLGTILDDDNPGKLSFGGAQYSGAENQTVTITVRRTNGTTGTIAVDYATQGGTASPQTDYAPVSGTLIFGDGEILKTFTVSIANDNVAEPSETVNLVLSNPIGGAGLGTPATAVLNIADDDAIGDASIAGSILYATALPDQKPVSGVVLNAAGSSSTSASTDLSGFYVIPNLFIGGQYTVTPSKTGNVNGITAFDATLVLRYVASGGQGANALTPNQQIAADANNSGTVTAFDATQILRYAAANAQTPNTGQVGNWKFVDAARNYPNLNNSLSGEDYLGILIGEVSGNWTPPNSFAEEIGWEQQSTQQQQKAEVVQTEETSVSLESAPNSDLAITQRREKAEISPEFEDLNKQIQLSLPTNIAGQTGEIVAVPVKLSTSKRASINAYSFDVRFDPAVLQPLADSFGKNETLSRSFSVVANTEIAGRISVAAASANESIDKSGTLLYLRFKVVGTAANAESTNLYFSEPPIFESENGSLTVHSIEGRFTLSATSSGNSSNVDSTANN